MLQGWPLSGKLLKMAIAFGCHRSGGGHHTGLTPAAFDRLRLRSRPNGRCPIADRLSILEDPCP
jgi:hypothetical protein